MYRSVEHEVLLALLGCGSAAQDEALLVQLLRKANWQSFLAIASQDLYPYLASRLEPHAGCLQPIPEWEFLRKARRCTAVHNLRLRHELAKAIEALKAAGIPAIALKGIVLAYTAYSDPSLRPMSDLDLLVPAGDREKALLVMGKLGFRCSESMLSLHRDAFVRLAREQEFAPALQLRESNVLLEVHTQLDCSEPILPVPIRAFWSRSTAAILHGLNVRTLSPEDLLFHLCMHQSRSHRFEKGLLPLLDIKLLLETRAHWDWAGIAIRALRDKCATWMYLTLEAARDLVAARVPDEFFEALPLPGDVSTLRCLVEEQIMSAHSGKPIPLLIPLLLAEHSWRRRARIIFTRIKMVRREELGPNPNLGGLIRGARIYYRRLVATLQVRTRRYLRAWKSGGLRIGTMRRYARLLRHSDALFRLVELESEFAHRNNRVRLE
jgi:hypothetical protein